MNGTGYVCIYVYFYEWRSNSSIKVGYFDRLYVCMYVKYRCASLLVMYEYMYVKYIRTSLTSTTQSKRMSCSCSYVRMSL